MRDYTVVYDNSTQTYIIAFRDMGDEVWYRDPDIPAFTDQSAAVRVANALNRFCD